MNLVLIEARELVDGVVAFGAGDRRAAHLRGVLGAGRGATVRTGVVGGALGRGEVIDDSGGAYRLRVTLDEPAPRPLPVELVLAIPRPKVLGRAVEIAASFGVERISLTNAWRVDKSYLASPRLAPEVVGHAARLGAEQGVTTHVPAVEMHARLMGMLDARWPAADAGDGGTRLIAHPGAPPIEDAIAGLGPIVLAVGPEGGWIPRELETFVARGFQPVSLGGAVLRVEAAIAAALAQIVLVRRLRASLLGALADAIA